MIEKIGRPAMLEQLAEEASKLAQAALKAAGSSCVECADYLNSVGVRSFHGHEARYNFNISHT